MGQQEAICAVMMHVARGQIATLQIATLQIATLQIAMLIVALSQTRGHLGAHQWTGASP
jgi:hypothetical protein